MAEAGQSPSGEFRIALALSGGGSRAMAFHLGCLRGLRRAGLLNQVAVISSVSGGSVLAALYCSTSGDFEDFEAKTREVLKRGFVQPALKKALTTPEGLKALAAFAPFAVDRLAAAAVGLVAASMRFEWPMLRQWVRESRLRRWASRTTILRRAFSDVFGGQRLTDLRCDRPRLIVVACELRAKAAFYFTADRLQCWRYGRADSAGVEIAHAVVASAAYPAALPALDECRTFEKDGSSSRHRIILTDGGVYDNMGLAPFWPDRSPQISLDPGAFDRIIACRAGYSLEVSAPPALFPSRMMAVVGSIHTRAQNFATARLFDLARSGDIGGVLLPYLGQDDARLGAPPANLVSRESVADYPTDFSPMSPEWIDRLSLRGEQLVCALLAEHWGHGCADAPRSIPGPATV